MDPKKKAEYLEAADDLWKRNLRPLELYVFYHDGKQYLVPPKSSPSRCGIFEVSRTIDRDIPNSGGSDEKG